MTIRGKWGGGGRRRDRNIIVDGRRVDGVVKTVQYTDAVFKNFTLESYIILLTKDTTINSIKI